MQRLSAGFHSASSLTMKAKNRKFFCVVICFVDKIIKKHGDSAALVIKAGSFSQCLARLGTMGRRDQPALWTQTLVQAANLTV